MVDVRKWHSVRDRDAAFVFLAHGDRGGLLVEADAEAFELRFDDFLVGEGFENVDDDEN